MKALNGLFQIPNKAIEYANSCKPECRLQYANKEKIINYNKNLNNFLPNYIILDICHNKPAIRIYILYIELIY